MKRPKALVFAPYLATAGGGERVIVAIAEQVAMTHDVRIVAPRRPDPQRWRNRGFPELQVEVLHARAVCRATVGLDLFVTQTNHLPLPSFAKRSLLVVQFPFDDLHRYSPIVRFARRRALATYDVATYTEFCRDHIAQRWSPSRVDLLAPPVQQFPYSTELKQKLIISVARFISTGHVKRQDVLLDAWERLHSALPEWRLQLIGGGSAGDQLVDGIVARAATLPRVTVSLDLPPAELAKAYTTAEVFWHATGFGRSPEEPETAEHFGISTVEAMSAGVVPIVFDDGGPAELVDPASGRRWRTIDGLVAATIELADDLELRRTLQANASARARDFTRISFNHRLSQLVENR